jgi:heat shock protein beta
LIQIFTRISEEEPDRFQEIHNTYGSIFKLGAVEDLKNREKLGSLVRFTTTHRNNTSFDDVGLFSMMRLTMSITDYSSSISKTRKRVRNRYMIHIWLFYGSLRVLQIFYLAEIGKKVEDLAQSVFVEKLYARGYEVLLLTEPLDEILLSNLRQWK